jgi:hypothetical protein
MTEEQVKLIHSIYSDILEIERMIKALKEVKTNIVAFNPYSEDNVTIDAPNFNEYLKEQTIFHYKGLLLDLKAKLENL